MRRCILMLALVVSCIVSTPASARPAHEIPTTNTINATVAVPAKLSFESAGSISYDRKDIIQQVLADGNVLLVGGNYDLEGCPKNYADLYNAVTHQVEAVGTPLYQTATLTTWLLEDGRVLVYNWSDCDDTPPEYPTQIYNPSTRAFEASPTILPRPALLLGINQLLAYRDRGVQFCRVTPRSCAPAVKLAQKRVGFAGTRLSNGDVLITGGTNPVVNAEVYRPSTGEVFQAGIPTVATGKNAGTVLTDGRVLFTADRSAEIYDPANRTFTPFQTNNHHIGSKGFRAPNGDIVVLSEDDIFTVFDPTASTFTQYTSTFPLDHTSVTPSGEIVKLTNYYSSPNYTVYRAVFSPANTFTGSLNYPTSWVQKQTIKVTVRGTSTQAPVAEVGLQSMTSNSQPIIWTPLEPGVAVSRTIDLLTQGYGRSVTMYLRDIYGTTAKIGTGYVKADLTAPVSQMAALPEFSRRNVVVNWSGTDNLSGIEGYALEMRVGPNGTWQRIASNVTKKSAGVQGTHGQQLFFRVRARDVAGLVEPWPDTYDAQTTVDTIGPRGVLDVSFVGQGSIQVLIAADDQPAGVQDMRIGLSYNFGQAQWEPFQGQKSVSRLNAPPGCLRVSGQFRDRAGNIGPITEVPVPGTGCSE